MSEIIAFLFAYQYTIAYLCCITIKRYQMETYRKNIEIVTEDDFHVATKATWRITNWANVDAPILHVSRSGSEYKIKDGILYRNSDHWGDVASCTWYLTHADGVNVEVPPWHSNKFRCGFVALSEMQRKISTVKRLLHEGAYLNYII